MQWWVAAAFESLMVVIRPTLASRGPASIPQVPAQIAYTCADRIHTDDRTIPSVPTADIDSPTKTPKNHCLSRGQPTEGNQHRAARTPALTLLTKLLKTIKDLRHAS